MGKSGAVCEIEAITLHSGVEYLNLTLRNNRFLNLHLIKL